MTQPWSRVALVSTPRQVELTMGRGRKRTDTLGEHGILGDEQAAELRSDLDHLRATVAGLSERLHAQFTTIAAHAEIAREQAEFARQEARADLDRNRDNLIGLIEQLRREANRQQEQVAGAAPGPPAETQRQRVEAVDAQLERLGQRLDTCFAQQRELADMVAAFLDTMLADQRGEPIAGLHLT